MHSIILVGQRPLQVLDSLENSLKTDSLTLEEEFNLLLVISSKQLNALTALEYAEKAQELARILDKPLLKARTFEEMSVIQRLLGNNIKSIAFSLEALKIYDLYDEKVMKASVLAQLGTNSMDDEEYEAGLNYLQQAKTIYERNEKTFLLGLTFINIGEIHRLKNDLDSALLYYQDALDINKEIGDLIIEEYSIGNIGMVYNAMNNLKEARKALEKALMLAEELNDLYAHAVYLAELGLVNQKEGYLQKAEKSLLKSLHIAQKEGLKDQVRDFSRMLVNLYKEQRKYSQALTYQELFQVYQDSLVNKENIKNTEQLKANYEIEKRKNAIDLLSERNEKQEQQKVFMGVVLVFFIAVALILYKGIKQKTKSNKLLTQQKYLIEKKEEEKTLLLHELNHRSKNNLNLISSVLGLQKNEFKGHPAEEVIAAGKYRVDALSMIHQKLYTEELVTQVEMKSYLADLTLNICYSYGDKLVPHLDLDEITLAIDQAIPLSLIVNELITNAFKYAYQVVESPQLLVSFKEEANLFILTVSDNGKGFDQESVNENRSFGIKLINSLIVQLKASKELSVDNGTSWIIKLPKN